MGWVSGGKDLRRSEGKETMIRIYCMNFQFINSATSIGLYEDIFTSV